MFQGNAEEATNYCLSIFEDFEITGIIRDGANEAGGEGSVKQATFSLILSEKMFTDIPGGGGK